MDGAVRMSGEERARIDCLDERGNSVSVFKAIRSRGDGHRESRETGTVTRFVYYTSDGYLVEPLSDGNFQVVLSGEILTRL